MEINAAWEFLRNENRNESGWHVLRVYPDSIVDLQAALRQPGQDCALLLEVSALSISRIIEYPVARGFDVMPEPVINGPKGRIRICLVSNDKNLQDIFAILAQDVSVFVSNTNSEVEAVQQFLARLIVWQTFMEKYSPSGLSINEQTGLFAELSILKQYFLTNLDPLVALDAWKGPEGGNQDFVMPGVAIEVKSSTTSPFRKTQITNLLQLDEQPFNNLYLCCLSLNTTNSTAAESLPNLVLSIREDFIRRDNLTALEVFNTKLLLAGYLDLQEQLYKERRYSISKVEFYHVYEDFPRLRQADIRAGIEGCSYTINLSTCSIYKIEPSSVIIDLLGELNARRT